MKFVSRRMGREFVLLVVGCWLLIFRDSPELGVLFMRL